MLTIMHKFMCTTNEFHTALKDLFVQHFEIHGYNTRNGLFYKVRYYALQDTLILFYNGLFSYGISVWGSTYPSLNDSIFVIQKRVIRAITFNKGTAHSNNKRLLEPLLSIKELHTQLLYLTDYRS